MRRAEALLAEFPQQVVDLVQPGPLNWYDPVRFDDAIRETRRADMNSQFQEVEGSKEPSPIHGAAYSGGSRQQDFPLLNDPYLCTPRLKLRLETMILMES